MAAITVGVPVYNEAARMEGCLEGLRTQTFTDFEVLIFDNASTDATGEIAQDFCARDPRFHYRRQATNRGPVVNHHDVMLAAASPYFVWRAADDSSALNYLEELYALLEANPSKALAVGRDHGMFRGEVIRTTPAPILANDGGLGDVRTLMFRSPPSWIYGLYRREPLAAAVTRIGPGYSSTGWAWDFLIMLPFFMDAAVVGTEATTFEVSLRPRRAEPGQPRPPRTQPDLDQMLAVRRQFLTIAQTFVDDRVPPGPTRTLWAALLWRYADRRVYKTRHIVRRNARRLIGLKP
jgi:glycosyltransferase involved in cell wall biosynthesis